jgi:hypothetical protein
MTARALLKRLHQEPFRPFRVRLSNKSTLDALDPFTVAVGPTKAIMPLETVIGDHGYYLVTRWRTVELADVVQLLDIDPPDSSTRRKAS